MSAPTSPEPEPLPDNDADMAEQVIDELGAVLPADVEPAAYLRAVLEYAEQEGGMLAASTTHDIAMLLIAAAFA
jgi:hypothetical protein